MAALATPSPWSISILFVVVAIVYKHKLKKVSVSKRTKDIGIRKVNKGEQTKLRGIQRSIQSLAFFVN